LANPNDKKHGYRVSGSEVAYDDIKEIIPADARKKIEPWLSAIFQCEHLSCVVGNGLTSAVSKLAQTTPVSMASGKFSVHGKAILEESKRSAVACGRDATNIEDDLRAANELLGGLRILGGEDYTKLKKEIDQQMKALLVSVLQAEGNLKAKFSTPEGQLAEGYLISFLMSFASRLPSRERLNIITTNYDRVIEHGCDKAGIRLIDRFVGALSPIFRSSRLNIDMHYNPPGIRGEPRYLEGVARLFKLHGSLDWRLEGEDIVRRGISFGGHATNNIPESPSDSVMIYPNAAKDMETLNYPYAELFRDFAAAVCRPNAAMVVFGFSFGDDHINRIIRDMLKIPSTHLVIIARSLNGRIKSFIDGHKAQVSYLLGTHFSDLENLVKYYLPKPAIDPLQARERALKDQRGTDHKDTPSQPESLDPEV